MGRIMIAGTNSGCGKTTVTCAVLQALVNRGLKVASFKCGPDYIDPMFHSKIIGTKSRNLDGFFMEPDVMNELLDKNSRGMDLSVIEGVMGYYDGLGLENTASSYAVARDTKTPVVLVLPCRGMSRSVQAMLHGYLTFVKDSGIRGVIFNQLPASLYPGMKDYCESQGLAAIGYFPKLPEAEIGSRHLGLITADEIQNLKERMQALAAQAEKYLDLDRILMLAGEAGFPEQKPVQRPALTAEGMRREKVSGMRRKIIPGMPDDGAAYPVPPLRIGVARDRAFCFYYEDNLDFLRELGCEIIPFSPLMDEALPEELDGVILGGGYPELYGKQLSENTGMLESLKEQIEQGLPVHAECGGFMYLHKYLQDKEGNVWQMADIFDGICYDTGKLQRFGYVTLRAQEDNLLCERGGEIRAHEFHHFDSTVGQNVFQAVKGKRSWNCYAQYRQVTAGFPHLHYAANPKFAKHFCERCREYRERK